MAANVDWYYHRKGCNTCTRMQALLEERGIVPKETESANKVRYDVDQALELVRGMNRLVAAKGKSVVDLNLKSGDVDQETLTKHLIGPSGKLRAPAIRKGKTLLIGFHETAFDEFLT